MAMPQFPPSLVKYDNPILVTPKPEEEATATGTSLPIERRLSKVLISENKEECKGNILHCILPPREYKEKGKTWIQYVSTIPATREDVLNLQEELNQKLLQNQARETGICNIRRSLYDECFDELIRQITLNSAERGVLLLRVRDELRMTLAVYETLYESSIVFGASKAVETKQDNMEIEKTLEKLRDTREQLNQEMLELSAKYQMIEKRIKEQRETDEKKYTEEIKFLKRVNHQLKTQLERIVNIEKHDI